MSLGPLGEICRNSKILIFVPQIRNDSFYHFRNDMTVVYFADYPCF